MKFYEVQERWNNLKWHTLAYFKRKQDADQYLKLYKLKKVSYPCRVEERAFSKISEIKKSLPPE
jgi:hypothetical protein